MKVVGIGVDIALKCRIKNLCRFSDRVVGRILRPSELTVYQKSQKRTECLGRFFSAKEAVFKSLGLTTFGPVGFRLIEISFGKNGESYVKLFGHLAKKSRHRIRRILLHSSILKAHILSQAISIQ